MTQPALVLSDDQMSSVLARFRVDGYTDLEVKDSSRSEDDLRSTLRVRMPSGRSMAIHITRSAFMTEQRVRDMDAISARDAHLGYMTPRAVASVNGHATETIDGYLCYAENWIDGTLAADYDFAGDEFKEQTVYFAALECANPGPQVASRTPWAFIDVCDGDEFDEADQLLDQLQVPLGDALGGDPRVWAFAARYRTAKADFAATYQALPEAAVQGDLNPRNVVVNDEGHMVGVIDYNLAGMERCLNYLLAECQEEPTVEGFGTPEQAARIDAVMKGRFAVATEEYRFSEAERAAFPTLYRLRMPLFWQTFTTLMTLIKGGRATDVMAWMEWISSRPDEEILALLPSR